MSTKLYDFATVQVAFSKTLYQVAKWPESQFPPFKTSKCDMIFVTRVYENVAKTPQSGCVASPSCHDNRGPVDLMHLSEAPNLYTAYSL